MDLRQLDYFVQIADAGSFSKASEMLSIAQPALSRQVRGLEVELRQALFLRNGRGVTLTPAGTRLLAHARGILQQVQGARADLDQSRDTPIGRVALGIPPTISRVLSGPLVAQFRERFPQSAISIVEGFTAHILEWLVLGRVDVGVVYNPPVASTIELRPLAEQQLCLISSARVRSAKETAPALLRHLPDYPLIIPSRPHRIRMLVDSRLAEVGLKPHIALEVDGVRAILDLVARGHGHAVLARGALSEAGDASEFVARPITRPRLNIALAIATSAQRPLTRMAAETSALIVALGPRLLEH